MNKLTQKRTPLLSALLLVILSALCPTKLHAQEFTIDWIKYSVIDQQKQYVSASLSDKHSLWYNRQMKLPEKVEYQGIEYTLTQIDYRGFSNSEITSITIPSSVSNISKNAFSNCNDLVSVIFAGSVGISDSAFADCTNLKSLIFNSSASISDNAFANCTNLRSIAYRGHVSCAINAFPRDCIKRCAHPSPAKNPEAYFPGSYIIYDIVIPNGDCSLGDEGLYNADKTVLYYSSGAAGFQIPQSVKSIGDYAFTYSAGLKSIHIPNTVTYISDKAFHNCGILKGAYPASSNAKLDYRFVPYMDNDTIKYDGTIYSNDGSVLRYVADDHSKFSFHFKNVTTIGNSAFVNCTRLQSIDIPNTVSNIGDYAFYGCSALTSISIPEGVPTIGDSAFYNCSALTSISIPKTVSYIGDNAFYNCSALPSISIPKTVSYIGDNAFYNCRKLSAITIPKTMSYIGDWAFYNCNQLPAITIPEGVPQIGDGTFYQCYSLASVSIPNSVTYIGTGAFKDCKVLTSVALPGSITECGKDAFSGCSKLKKNAYPSSIKNPFPSGFSIEYPAEGAMIEDGLIWGKDKTALYFAPLDIQTFTVPESLRLIGENAFKLCDGLTSITATGSNAPTISANSFEGLYAKCQLTAPYTYLLHSYWYKFADMDITDKSISCRSGEYFNYITFDDRKEAYIRGYGRRPTIAPETNIREKFDDIIYDVTGICAGAFDNTGIRSIKIRNSIKFIGDHALENTKITNLELPASVEIIGDYAFANNQKLTSVVLGENVNTIGNYAFNNNYLIKAINLPNSLISIGDYAFYGCNLESVALPESVKTIGNYSFADNPLDDIDIVIPPSTTYIGDGAFKGIISKGSLSDYPKYFFSAFTFADCTSPITLGSNILESRGTRALKIGRNYIGDTDAFKNRNIKSLSLGNLVTEIPDSAFESSGLHSVTLGSGITDIPANAFSNNNIREITIPANVTSIGERAFEDNHLSTVAIGCGAVSIGEKAFNDNGISTLHITTPEPPTINDNVFSTTYAQLNVLPGTQEAYAYANGWYQFETAALKPISAVKLYANGNPIDGSSAIYSATDRKQIQFTVTTEPADASLVEHIFWSSSNPDVAIVDNNGLLKFTGATDGDTEIIAHTLYADVAAAANVTADGKVSVSGIEYTTADRLHDSPCDIYNLQGILLKRNATQDDIEALTTGLYIIAGRKVYVK